MSKSLTPHGPGFSFIDSFEVIEPGVRGRSQKYLDPTLPFFADHFPGNPLMPGVLLVECAAQAAGALWGSIQKKQPAPRYAIAQVDTFRFRKPILPGTTLAVEVRLIRDFGLLAKFEVTIYLPGNEEAATGQIILSAGVA